MTSHRTTLLEKSDSGTRKSGLTVTCTGKRDSIRFRKPLSQHHLHTEKPSQNPSYLKNVVPRGHVCDVDPLAVDVGSVCVVAAWAQALKIHQKPKH